MGCLISAWSWIRVGATIRIFVSSSESSSDDVSTTCLQKNFIELKLVFIAALAPATGGVVSPDLDPLNIQLLCISVVQSTYGTGSATTMLRSAIHVLLSVRALRRGPTAAAALTAFVGRYDGYSTASSHQRLAGKVAVITGAASGMGNATAAEFVRNGAKVILADIQDDLGKAVAAELGPDAFYARCDVTDEDQIAAVVDLAVARHGQLDIMYNHAGVTGSKITGSIVSLDLADFDRTMAANARSVVAGIKHAARVMVPRGSGCILCTASTAGILGGITPAYGISKAAVIGAVRAVAGELGRHGVRVNAISPHLVPTPFCLRALAEILPEGSPEDIKRMVETALNEMGGTAVLQVEDIARAALYLASGEANYVNGHNLVVDGGYTVGKIPSMPAPML
uniref:Uncharacterized protein n=1 Tax=Avena sativa TaxID=4498 RepID=A0ACD5ZDN2_AVESA